MRLSGIIYIAGDWEIYGWDGLEYELDHLGHVGETDPNELSNMCWACKVPIPLEILTIYRMLRL